MQKLGSLFGLAGPNSSSPGKGDVTRGNDKGDEVSFFPQFGDPKTRPQFIEFEYDEPEEADSDEGDEGLLRDPFGFSTLDGAPPPNASSRSYASEQEEGQWRAASAYGASRRDKFGEPNRRMNCRTP